jgi:tRNA A-37 threonylcarbamoyl transferase component Bud32
MAKYCCFFCPSKDYAERGLDDKCPSCGRTYGFVLDHPPARILSYRITKHLGRGFYGAAYVAEAGFVGKKYVIKISPVAFYNFEPFKKTPFQDEVQLHARLAASATHVVGIIDAIDATVVFGDDSATSVPCHVTVLDYVEGDLLKDFANSSTSPSAASICQVAIDLLQLRAELEANKLNHNDLHSENLIVERLRPESRRPDAVDPMLRVMAIDLGSISDESKSTADRQGDLGFIANHVNALLDRLLAQPDQLEDRDFRIALALQGIISNLRADAQNLRLPNPADMVAQIKESFYRASHHWRPWKNPLRLMGFADHYNAQTLESWDVPKLLVDPANRWLTEITRPGPQIITGMRGCGKTMLLRALDIHARATLREGETSEMVIQRLRNDRYVGLFVSAQRLLDLREQSLLKLEYRLTRLFLAYALQAARALMHLRDVDPGTVAPRAHTRLASAVADYMEGADDLRHSISLDDLEKRLQRIAVLTVSGGEKNLVKQAPAEVFNHLANSLRECSEAFESASIFYLLDDVSTRYLELDKIEAVLSALLFQSPTCAFKFTSEWQTIELGLRSPGRNHPIRIGRDLTVFDLGEDVFKTINAPGSAGKDFVAQILQLRAGLHAQHPRQRDPKVILGDVPLEQVAREIASSTEGAGQKKRVYRGLSCLTSVCVGDIGDVIKLYEEILRRAGNSNEYPIEEHIQSECFQEMSARRLYDLNRRANYSRNLKNHALAFAQTAHDLLVRSYRNAPKDRKSKPRLRQYSSIYVRVTAEDENSQKQQIDRLRDLIDAGVFVFAGGAPRTKTKDSDPILQFILSYRKIYGLAAFIGLADRDRFELSGDDLSRWLELDDVAAAKEILLRNQINDEVDEIGVLGNGHTGQESENSIQEQRAETASAAPQAPVGRAAPRQCDLFGVFESETTSPEPKAWAEKVSIAIYHVSENELATLPVSSALVGLGFEDRTLASNKFLSGALNPGTVHAIRYPVEGHSRAILNAWCKSGTTVVETSYDEALAALPRLDGLALVDISGLAKPLIFKAVRSELVTKGRVLVCHTSAKRHYPLQEDIEKLFAAEKSKDPVAFLESLAELLTGEDGPYKDIKLLDDVSDPSRNRALLAFASPKHERLFSLLDRREFDQIEIITPEGDAPHAKVATYAAEFICQNYPNASVTGFGSDDLLGLVEYLDAKYLEIYGTSGANFELGLTGTKTQALAVAILSSVRKVSQAWYLSPKRFDEKRFSSGVGSIRVYDISIPRRSC